MEIAVEIFIALLTLVFVFYPLITERPAESVSQEMDI